MVCLLALTSMGTGTVLAQNAEVTGVEMTPAKFEADLTGRDFSYKMSITNHETSARRIKLSIAGLGHDLNGTPKLIEPSDLADSADLSEDDFVLAAGDHRTFVFSGSIPAGDTGLYAAVIAELLPVDEPPQQVDIKARVASLFLLRGPRPWIERVQVKGVGLLPGSGRRLSLFATVANTGDVHVNPEGSIAVVQGGRVLETVVLTGETIIPGFARRLTGEWTPPRDLSGRVTLRATIENPDASGEDTVSFFEGSPDRPGATIVDLDAASGSPAAISVTVKNTGTIALAPAVDLSVARGGSVFAAKELVPSELEPGKSTVLRWQTKLDPGNYAVTAKVGLDGTLLDQGIVGLQVKAESGSPVLALLATALLIVALIAFFIVRRTHRTS